MSGSKGIACIAVAVVDGEGNLVQHQNYPKPLPSAHLEVLDCTEFASLTLTKLYESGSSLNQGPSEYTFSMVENGNSLDAWKISVLQLCTHMFNPDGSKILFMKFVFLNVWLQF